MVGTQYSVSLFSQGHSEGECIKDNKTYSVGFPPQVIWRILTEILHAVSLKFFQKNLKRLRLLYVGSWITSLTCWLSLPLPLITIGGSSWRSLYSPQSAEASTQQPLALALKTFYQAQPGASKTLETKMLTCRAGSEPQWNKQLQGRFTPFSVILHLQSKNNY